ncbi:MAG: T9SS type A sorting domain-containing protein [Chitinophagales bacterium]|nr:T9SS type A sorting domain-containing protein [Chitinophagales bacterium]
MNLKLYSLFVFIAVMSFSFDAVAQCEVGTMTTTGTVTAACDTDVFDVETDGSEVVPATGGFGWVFSTVLGGTGALGGDFILTGADNPGSYDADLNGLLSANGLPPFSGEWVIKAAVYSDAGDAFNTICALSTDSLIVDFQGLASPTIDSVVDNGDGSATVTASGGMMPYTYEWSDGQTTQTATGLAEGVYTVTVTDANGCTASGEVAIGNASTCEAGVLTTTGNVSACGTNSFTVETDDSKIVPAAGGFGWLFLTNGTGTGALNGDFILTGANDPSTYDADLNGLLSANGLPPFAGQWVVKAAVYDNAADAFNSICSTSSDSLIVDFSGSVVVTDVVNNGDGSATVMVEGGQMPYTYEWSDGQTTETATGLADGTYTVTVTDAGGCSASGSVTIGDVMDEPCLDWLNPNPTGGWTDFNSTFGGAPCDDGSGCPFNEITAFEVFSSEAYAIDNFVEGGTYTFSMCNGPGAGTWVPEFTIIAPSGAVDAFGAGDGDGCSITWTASESGTYLIVINEAGECGGGNNTGTGNGYPALTCENVECPEIPCSVGELTGDDEIVICNPDEDTFDLATDGTDTIPDAGGFGWQFSDASGGTGGLAGGFTLTGAANPATYDNDLNGVLSSNNLEPLSGVWVVYGVVYSNANAATGSICATTTDSIVLIFNEPMEVAAQDNGDNTATALVAGGTEPYTFEWSDGQTTQTAVNLSSGSYTVTITDALGCSEEAGVDVISEVGDIEKLESLYLGPNPTSGALNLQLQLDSPDEVRVEVRNVTGQVINQNYFGTQSNVAHEFDFAQLAEGVYFVRIVVGQDEITKRVILTK